MDPELILDTLFRYIDLLHAVEKTHPVQDEKKNNTYQDTLAGYENYRDRLKDRLESTDGYRRCPVNAEHIEKESQQRTPLKMFLSRVGKTWVLVDWTNPASRSTTGEYRGRGTSDREAVEKAFQAWKAQNRYPDGEIEYSFSADFIVEPITGQFDTDGNRFWENAQEFFDWAGYWSSFVSEMVNLTTKVPRFQHAIEEIEKNIKKIAQAQAGIEQRQTEGFEEIISEEVDVLLVVSNTYSNAIGPMGWTRGSALVVHLQENSVEYVFIGRVADHKTMGIWLPAESSGDYEEITQDTSLVPIIRIQKLVHLFNAQINAGKLMYVEYKNV